MERPTTMLIGRAATDQPQSPVAIGSASTNAMHIQMYIAKVRVAPRALPRVQRYHNIG
jgi:hypothetical protein